MSRPASRFVARNAAGSDGGDPMQNAVGNGYNNLDGTISTPAVTDLASDGFGQDFGLTRVWTNRLVDQLSPTSFGNGWIMSDMPTLINANTTVIANIDGNSSLFFDLMPEGSPDAGSYVARFFNQEKLAYDSSSDMYTLTDTVGDTLTFYGFSPSLNIHQRGQIASFADPAGNTINYNYDPSGSGQLQTVTRTDGTVTETWTFTYNPTAGTTTDSFDIQPSQDPATDPNDPTPYEVNLVTLSRTGGEGTGLVRQVAYSYYSTPTSTPAYGGVDDLRSAVLEDASGTPLATYYYVYTGYDYAPDYDPSNSSLCLGGALTDELAIVFTPNEFALQAVQNCLSGGNLDSIDLATLSSIWDDAQYNLGDILGGAPAVFAPTTSPNPAIGTNIWAYETEIYAPRMVKKSSRSGDRRRSGTFMGVVSVAGSFSAQKRAELRQRGARLHETVGIIYAARR
jgi:YD repeat-containing protein